MHCQHQLHSAGPSRLGGNFQGTASTNRHANGKNPDVLEQGRPAWGDAPSRKGGVATTDMDRQRLDLGRSVSKIV